MKSSLIYIIIAAVFICVGWFIGGIITPFFTGAGAILATVALISTIRKNKNG